jgi:hypothetical protein
VRTLVISDLHLGGRAGHDVLRFAPARDRLLAALDGVDRLVLLGDTLELHSRHARRSGSVAEALLRQIGRRLGSDGEVIVVPGNHDLWLVADFKRTRGEHLGIAEDVDPLAGSALEKLLSWLAPARARACYPGVWLADGVWATHGHYLDLHLLPRSAFGLPRGRLRRRDPARVAAVAYESARRRPPVGDGRGTRLGAVPLSRVPSLLKEARLAPVTARLMDLQVRHAAIPAIDMVARRLGVEAEWIIFGHVHRRGPLPGDRWPAGATGIRFANTGSWLYEPVLLDGARPPHPYWPGGAVMLEEGREPRSIGLLDDLRVAALTGRGEIEIGGEPVIPAPATPTR